MMDPQQIREAVEAISGSTVTDDKLHDAIELLMNTSAEYADLLEASERVWWCEAIEQGGRQMLCDDGVHDYKGCGWRLLIPTQGE